MSDKKSDNSSWFFSALTLLFIGLKLTHYITWSWWWVLAPVWMPISAGIAGLVIYLLIDWAYKSKAQKAKEAESKKIMENLENRFNGINLESKFLKALREAQERSNARDN